MKTKTAAGPLLLILACAALALLPGPLRTQESSPAAEAAEEEAGAPEPAAEAPAPPRTADEGLSADNSLSFPVDI